MVVVVAALGGLSDGGGCVVAVGKVMVAVSLMRLWLWLLWLQFRCNF